MTIKNIRLFRLITIALALVVLVATTGSDLKAGAQRIWGQMPWARHQQSTDVEDVTRALMQRSRQAWFVVFATRENPRLMVWGADTPALAKKAFDDCQAGRLTPGKTVLYCRLARQENIWLSPDGLAMLSDAGRELVANGHSVGDVYRGLTPPPSLGPLAQTPGSSDLAVSTTSRLATSRR